jgi:hypothetical protein
MVHKISAESSWLRRKVLTPLFKVSGQGGRSREVRTLEEVRAALVGFKAGQSVALEIVSRGEARTVSVVLRSPSGWD